MRIIAGVAGGRRLEGPPGTTTRPMTDRMREALFSSLAVRVPGAHVLDLYAGTGSVGLEALSRGAERAVFVERDGHVTAVLERNIASLGLGGVVVQRDVDSYVRDLMQGERGGDFDLVFVDPPYAMPLASVVVLVEQLGERLHQGSLVVVHRRGGGDAPEPKGFDLEWNRSYGSSELWRFERMESA